MLKRPARRRALSSANRAEIEWDLGADAGRRLPDVWLIEGMGQPFVWGLVRGGVYLPSDFFDVCGREHRRDVLAHELAHVARYDAAINILQVVAQTVFWFHPLVWWANRQIRREREKCCDETAIARLGTSPKRYGEAIVEVLAAGRKSARATPSLAIAGPATNTQERIELNRVVVAPNVEHRNVGAGQKDRRSYVTRAQVLSTFE